MSQSCHLTRPRPLIVLLEKSEPNEQSHIIPSPPRLSSPVRASHIRSFFTPSGPSRSSRPDPGPSALPIYATLNQTPVSHSRSIQESPLASQTQHSRSRALSSASMVARGLVLHPQHPNPPLLAWPHAQVDTPSITSGQSMSRVTSDDADSPSLQTPSTGQRGFPTVESLGFMDVAMGGNATTNYWRSATDPSHSRTFTYPHVLGSQQMDYSSEWGSISRIESGKESPPMMTKPTEMLPPPQPLHYPPHHYTSQAQNHSAVLEQIIQAPFTPPTSVPLQGLNAVSGGIPMYYNTTFHPAQAALSSTNDTLESVSESGPRDMFGIAGHGRALDGYGDVNYGKGFPNQQ